MPKRNPFTEAEDDHLVEFIAKNNLELPGRSGNKLYQTLVDNPKRWPWSKSHPWQSWRERYIKNAVWFDRKIRSYQKKLKNKAPNEAEDTNQAEGRTVKRKGPPKAAETNIDERKRTALVNQQSPSKVTGDASVDSGYASTTKKTPDDSEKNRSELHASERPSHTTETKRHGLSGDNTRIPSSSGYQSTAKPPRPLRQEEDNISQTEESAEGEERGRGMPKERTEDDDFVHELFGSFAEDEEEDVTNPPASSAPTSPTTEITYPDIRNVPPDIAEKQPHVADSVEFTRLSQNPSPLKSGSIRPPSPHPPPPSVHHPARPVQGKKRLLKRKLPDDPFIDNTPPQPTPERHPATRKAPGLNGVPIQNPYVPTRNPAENVWPPNRKRKESEGPKKFTETHTPTNRAVIGRKTQVTSIASSSKVKIPPSTAHRPDNLVGTALQVSTQMSVPMPKDAALQKTTAAISPYEGTKTSERAVVTEQPPTKRRKVGHPAVTHQGSSHNTLAVVPTSTPATQGNHRVNDERPATRHIDLRESLKKRRLSGKSSLLSSSISNKNSISNLANRRDSAASSTSRQRVSNDGDLEILSLFERDLSELGEQYGFSLGVVKKTYLQFGTLEKTVVALRALNAIMKDAQHKLHGEMHRFWNKQDHDDTNESDVIPEGLIPKGVSSGGKGKDKEVGGREHHEASSDKQHRQSHDYEYPTTEVEDQLEYSSPSKTYADQYTEGGREEDGRSSMPFRNGSREERVSDGREFPRCATTIRRGLEPSSPLDPDREHSPTPDEDESVPQRVTVERHEEEEDVGDIDVAMHDGSDVSPDEYEEPTPDVKQVDDEELVLKAELKRLCFDVTLENQNILRAFEERQDCDLWGTERGDWVTQMFSSLIDAQKIRRQAYYQMKARKTEEREEHEPVADESILS